MAVDNQSKANFYMRETNKDKKIIHLYDIHSGTLTSMRFILLIIGTTKSLTP